MSEIKPNIEIIPAIDLIDGKIVRLRQGDYNQCTFYPQEPVQMAQYFANMGYKRLHIIDLEGARSSKPQNTTWRVIEDVVKNTSMSIEFGGGVKTMETLELAFNAGADRVICGSVAVKNPELMEEMLFTYTGRKICWGADLKQNRLAVSGWLSTQDVSMDALMERFFKAGLQTVHCTQVACDGMMQGPDVDLYASLQKQYPQVTFVACGGICAKSHLEALAAVGITQAVVGRAFYEGGLSNVG